MTRSQGKRRRRRRPRVSTKKFSSRTGRVFSPLLNAGDLYDPEFETEFRAAANLTYIRCEQNAALMQPPELHEDFPLHNSATSDKHEYRIPITLKFNLHYH